MDKLFEEQGIELLRKNRERFLLDVLEIPLDSSFDQLVNRFKNRIPFQSVTLLATPPEKRHVPSLPESVQFVLNGIGGCCYSLNPFMKYFLEIDRNYKTVLFLLKFCRKKKF